MNKLITIIGRGRSGTRLISHTLQKSGVYMGSKVNLSGDLVPYFEFYEACRIISKHITHLGNNKWDFSNLQTCDIDSNFIKLINIYLKSVLSNKEKKRGWKIPETTLCLPWIVRMFPEINYIHLIRDPRDNISGYHITDDLSYFGIPYQKSNNEIMNRAISWKYNIDIVNSIPKPKNWLEIKFEDFILKQNKTLKTIEKFLGFPLKKIPVNPNKIGNWDKEFIFEFLKPYLNYYGYNSGRKCKNFFI